MKLAELGMIAPASTQNGAHVEPKGVLSQNFLTEESAQAPDSPLGARKTFVKNLAAALSSSDARLVLLPPTTGSTTRLLGDHAVPLLQHVEIPKRSRRILPKAVTSIRSVFDSAKLLESDVEGPRNAHHKGMTPSRNEKTGLTQRQMNLYKSKNMTTRANFIPVLRENHPNLLPIAVSKLKEIAEA
jgi:hypothetical protein